MVGEKKSMPLKVVSQDKELLSLDEVTSITALTTVGVITILPGHIAIFNQIKPGYLVYRQGKEEHSIVVSKGFIEVTPMGQVTVMVDSGVLARDISVERAENAIKAAHETMSKTRDQREFMLAEASLRQAMLEIQIAHKTRKSKI